MPDDAAFCPICGTKYVRKDVCPKCGKPFAEGEIYCTACGTRLDGKLVCRNCGTVFEGRFCPKCGTEVRSAVSREVAVKDHESSFDWKRLVSLIGGGFAMGAVLFSLLFTFFIGFKTSWPPELSTQASVASGRLEFDIWYFFNKAYKDVDTLLKAFATQGAVSTYSKSTLYAEAVIGTVVSVATIVTVVVFSILAVVYFVRDLLHKPTKSAGKFACLAFFCFTAGTLALRALYDIQMRFSSIEESYEVVFGNNAATTAGLAVGAVCLAIWFGCTIAVRGKEIIEKETLRELIPTLCGIVLLIVVVALAGYGATGISSSMEELLANGATVEIKLGFMSLFDLLSTTFYSLPYDGSGDLALVYSYLAAVLTIAVVVFSCLTFARFAETAEGHTKVLPMAIILTICAILYTVFSILSINATTNAIMTKMELSAEVNTSFTTAIVVCSFSVLVLAAAIVQRVLGKKAEKEAE